MLSTRFTELVGCSVPIQLAGLGGLVRPPLVAVSEAGGLGMLGAVGLPAPLLAELLDQLKGQTARPVGVNFLMPFLEDRQCVVVAARRAALVEFAANLRHRRLHPPRARP